MVANQMEMSQVDFSGNQILDNVKANFKTLSLNGRLGAWGGTSHDRGENFEINRPSSFGKCVKTLPYDCGSSTQSYTSAYAFMTHQTE